jgi:hypothetical protein
MLSREENLATLRALIEAPCLGVVPRMPSPDPALIAAHLDISPLIDKDTARPCPALPSEPYLPKEPARE